jgi:hypothetical protein
MGEDETSGEEKKRSVAEGSGDVLFGTIAKESEGDEMRGDAKEKDGDEPDHSREMRLKTMEAREIEVAKFSNAEQFEPFKAPTMVVINEGKAIGVSNSEMLGEFEAPTATGITITAAGLTMTETEMPGAVTMDILAEEEKEDGIEEAASTDVTESRGETYTVSSGDSSIGKVGYLDISKEEETKDSVEEENGIEPVEQNSKSKRERRGDGEKIWWTPCKAGGMGQEAGYAPRESAEVHQVPSHLVRLFFLCPFFLYFSSCALLFILQHVFSKYPLLSILHLYSITSHLSSFFDCLLVLLANTFAVSRTYSLY